MHFRVYLEVYVYENPTSFSRWSVRKPAIYEGYGRLISPGMNVTIEIDAFQGDKKQIKDDLTSIFAEVLEYFD